MKLWPYSWSGPEFLTAYTVAIVLAVLAWLLLRERQRGAVRDRIREVPLDTYQLAYLRGGALAAVESALLSLGLAGKVTRAGEMFAAIDGATLDDSAPELERAILANLDHRGPTPRRRLVSHLGRGLCRIDLHLVERGWMASHPQRRAESVIAKLPLVAVGVAGVARVFQGVAHAAPVGFLLLELLVLAALLAVLPRLPPRTARGDAALAHHRRHHDALVRTAATAPAQLAPIEVALAYALAGTAVGIIARDVLGVGRAQHQGCAAATAGCASSSGSASSCGNGGSSCGGGGGCGGCGGGGD